MRWGAPDWVRIPLVKVPLELGAPLRWGTLR